MFPEYKEAKKELDEVYNKAKEELAEKVRPIFFKKFEDLFNEFPEIEFIKWDNSTSIYNDEEYSEGVESLRVRLHDQYTTEAFREDNDEWMNYDDYSYDLLSDDEITQLIGSVERVELVSKKLIETCRFIDRLDFDFLKVIFDDNCTVTVTKKGFTVE